MTACPNGHQSATADYCDQCGARIAGAASPPAPPPASPHAEPAGTAASGPAWADPAATAATGDEACPACATPRVGQDRYCEGCGHDFTAPPGSQPANAATGPPAAWEAIVTADHEYYERMGADDVPFPVHCPPRSFLLAGSEISVGRRSASRGVQPVVDLSGAPEDTAISHLHALLIEQPDGSYSLVDPGSTNGTSLNDDLTPLAANVAVALADGDRIHLGAWTTITVRARRGPPP
jgi:hypothetical protein